MRQQLKDFQKMHDEAIVSCEEGFQEQLASVLLEERTLAGQRLIELEVTIHPPSCLISPCDVGAVCSEAGAGS